MDKKEEKAEEFPEFETNIDVFNPESAPETKKEKRKLEEQRKEKTEQEKQVEQDEEAGKKEELTNEKSKEDKQLTKEKSEDKKKKQPEKIKKEKAIINVRNLGISTKHSMAICDFIRGRIPEQAIEKLEQVVKLKKAIPMKGEIPHRKGMMSGRYPINASKVFIKLIKQLVGNASVNGLENPYISLARADKASRPHKRFGSMRFKRTNVVLEAREKAEKTVNAKERRNVEPDNKSMKDKQLTNKKQQEKK